MKVIPAIPSIHRITDGNAAMQTNTKHTPGPWRTIPLAGNFDSHVGAFGIAYGRAGNRLAIVDGEGNSSAHNAANARVIAAAPDLLEALEAMMKLRNPRYLTDTERADIINAAVAAIAKARGEV